MSISLPRIKVTRFASVNRPNNLNYKIALPSTFTKHNIKEIKLNKDHCFTMNFCNPVEAIELSLEHKKPLIIADYFFDFESKELKKVDFIATGNISDRIILR